MELEKHVLEQLTYNDEIPDPEEEAPPRNDEADALRHAARKRLIPADEDNPSECFSEKLI